MEASRDIQRLLDIMKALRDPQTGCPWDIVQDFKSIYPYTIEEAYEVAEAIERDDMDDLRLELGDLLLQSVYHAQIASEASHFDFGDVVEGITAKMIRRHPHVFGTADASREEYSARGLENETWERIKAEEKAEQDERRKQMGLQPKYDNGSVLEAVPSNLPPLSEALKLQKKAAKLGFDWDNAIQVLEKLREEIDEFSEAEKDGNHDAKEEEFGDLLFCIVNYARHHHIDPETALRRCNRKFRKRFGHVETYFSQNGLSIEDASLDEMEEQWKIAKKLEKQKAPSANDAIEQ